MLIINIIFIFQSDEDDTDENLMVFNQMIENSQDNKIDNNSTRSRKCEQLNV